MKRPAAWHLARQRTAKAMREYPRCATPDCEGRAVGIFWGSVYCPQCQGEKRAEKMREAQRAQRERT